MPCYFRALVMRTRDNLCDNYGLIKAIRILSTITKGDEGGYHLCILGSAFCNRFGRGSFNRLAFGCCITLVGYCWCHFWLDLAVLRRQLGGTSTLVKEFALLRGRGPIITFYPSSRCWTLGSCDSLIECVESPTLSRGLRSALRILGHPGAALVD